MEFGLYPFIYKTGANTGLRSMLEELWPNNAKLKGGSIYIVAGFANFNGGARFFKCFKELTEAGGNVYAILAGSAAQRTSSRQVVEAMIGCGAKVWVTNRKSLMHAKLYGCITKAGDQHLVVTSGNFTGPGMSRNVEASIKLDETETKGMGFDWGKLFTNMLGQTWPTLHVPKLNSKHPAWPLLYDEGFLEEKLDQTEETTLLLLLSHSDTARIQAKAGTDAAKGTQYFWLSKDCFDFFPPLLEKNKRGYKGTLSALIDINFIALNRTEKIRVTFEAENNLDFRLGTGPLRGTRLASEGDLACLTRTGETTYEMRTYKKNSTVFNQLSPFASSYVGGKGKRYGMIPNEDFRRFAGLPARSPIVKFIKA